IAFREAFCVIFTSSKFPSLKSAVRIRTCREIPARRVCRRSVRVAVTGGAGTGADSVVGTGLKCSDIGLDRPLRETRSGLRSPPAFSPPGRRLPIEQGYRFGGTKGGALQLSKRPVGYWNVESNSQLQPRAFLSGRECGDASNCNAGGVILSSRQSRRAR